MFGRLPTPVYWQTRENEAGTAWFLPIVGRE
jgi:hypothetical protein